MPYFNVATTTLEIRRDVVVLDTNVLYSAFNSGDSRSEDVWAFLAIPSQLIVPLAVLVEAWGLLVGRDGEWQSGFDLLNWLIDPRSGAVVVHVTEDVATIQESSREFHVDCVDSIILHLAERISRECQLNPACRIVTYDSRDFLRFLAGRQYSAVVLDLATLDETALIW